MSIDIPSSEEDKLYPFVPSNLAGIIIVSLLVLGMLIVDVASGETTNVFVFYSIPFLYLFVLFQQENTQILLNSIGMDFSTRRSKIVALLSVPVGILIGKLLVNYATAPGSIFPVATFPFVATSLSTAGSGFILSIISSLTGTITFFVAVGLFEEITSIVMGKVFANWLFKKGLGLKNQTISILGFLLGRVILVTHHFISYGGFSKPILYISALFYFSLFTLLGISAGLIAKGKSGEISANKVLPILSPIMIVVHIAFDVFVTLNLMG